MLVAIGSAYESKAQKKVFLNEYNRLLQWQTNPTYARTMELTHFTGEIGRASCRERVSSPV